MDSLKIDTGVIRLQINDGPEEIAFNPNDVLWAERFYQVVQDFRDKKAEYQERAKTLDAHSLDEDGLPANLQDGIAFMKEACTYMRGRIDFLFGDGTSQKVFGDALVLEAIAAFFEAITPYVKTARTDKVAKYAASDSRVMK